MKKIIYLTLTLVLISLIFVACKNSGEESQSSQDTPQATPTPEPEEDLDLDVDLFDEGEELSGTLVISSDVASTYAAGYFGIYPLAEGFNELHPNVEIIVEGYNRVDQTLSPEELEVEGQTYKNDLHMQLLSGTAPDLIFTGRDYTSNLAFTDNIRDLNAFMQNDPNFNKDDYYMNVFEAFEVTGKLYNMPNTFSFDFLRMREDVIRAAGIDPSTVETVDYKFLLDVQSKAMASGKIPDLKYIAQHDYTGNALLYKQEISTNFNSDTMTANFDSPEFIEYLNFTKEHAVSQYTYGYFPGPIYDRNDSFVDDSYFVQEIGMLVGYETGKFKTAELPGITDPIPVVTSNGEVLVYPGFTMSIPTNAKNPALAWEFIKYCIYDSGEMPDGLEIENLSRWDGDRFSSDIPVNKNNMKNYINGQFTTSTQEEKDYLINLYNDTLTLPIIAANVNTYLPAYNNQTVTDYYENDGMYTAEEVAKALQERTEIYLNEIA